MVRTKVTWQRVANSEAIVSKSDLIGEVAALDVAGVPKVLIPLNGSLNKKKINLDN